uniref:Uncharacterized protein n=1 Tax=Pararge aegeria TaxID=116150 RepID=S4NSF2_9NEOP
MAKTHPTTPRVPGKMNLRADFTVQFQLYAVFRDGTQVDLNTNKCNTHYIILPNQAVILCLLNRFLLYKHFWHVSVLWRTRFPPVGRDPLGRICTTSECIIC